MSCSYCRTQALTSFILSVTGSVTRQSRASSRQYLQNTRVWSRALSTSLSRETYPVPPRFDHLEASTRSSSSDDAYLPFDRASVSSLSRNPDTPELPSPFTPPPAPSPLYTPSDQVSSQDARLKAQEDCLQDPEIRFERSFDRAKPEDSFTGGLGPDISTLRDRIKPQSKQGRRLRDNQSSSAESSGSRDGVDEKDHRSLRDRAQQKVRSLDRHSRTHPEARHDHQHSRRKDSSPKSAQTVANGEAPSAGQSPSGSRKPWPRKEHWQIYKDSMKAKFSSEGWNPRKKLSPDAMDGVRALHAQYPNRFTTSVLADEFKVSPEAIRRILKSKWRPNPEEDEQRRQRWDRRGETIWSKLVEEGAHPPKKWREMGIGSGPRRKAQDRSLKRREQDFANSDNAASLVINDDSAWVTSLEERLAL